MTWNKRVQLKLQSELDMAGTKFGAAPAGNNTFFFSNYDRVDLPYACAIIEVKPLTFLTLKTVNIL